MGVVDGSREFGGRKKKFRAEVMNEFCLAQHVFIGRTDAKAEAPKLWPLDAKRLIRIDLEAGKD